MSRTVAPSSRYRTGAIGRRTSPARDVWRARACCLYFFFPPSGWRRTLLTSSSFWLSPSVQSGCAVCWTEARERRIGGNTGWVRSTVLPSLRSHIANSCFSFLALLHSTDPLSFSSSVLTLHNNALVPSQPPRHQYRRRDCRRAPRRSRSKHFPSGADRRGVQAAA
jgi:hypothetical protein